jgi:hypothetical protein
MGKTKEYFTEIREFEILNEQNISDYEKTDNRR